MKKAAMFGTSATTSRNLPNSADPHALSRYFPPHSSMPMVARKSKIFCSTSVAVRKVHGNTSDRAGTTVRYGIVYCCEPESGGCVSWDIHSRYRRAPVRTVRKMQATRHPLVKGGMLTRGGILSFYPMAMGYLRQFSDTTGRGEREGRSVSG